MRRVLKFAVASATAAMVLSACGEAPEEESSDSGSEETEASSDFKGCLVSDSGGFDDQSFNQSAKEGLDAAADEMGIEPVEVESQSDSEYTTNVSGLVDQDCNLVIGVGFLLEEAVQEAAEQNPETNFALIDSAFTDENNEPVELENAKPLLFNTAEAAFLAGYAAAGMSETDTVATFGGLQIPSVTIFMDGFADGVNKYNEDNEGEVELLGWDKEAQNGSFSGDFENQAAGQTLTEQFIAQDADVVMPVAGPVGLGAAAAAESADGVKLIWVDSDGYESTDYGDIILTSVVKQIGQSVQDTISETADGNFSAEPYVGTLENEGVGIAPFHDFEDEVPQELMDQIDEYREQIIAGDLVIESPSTP